MTEPEPHLEQPGEPAREPEHRIGYAERPDRGEVAPWALAFGSPAVFLAVLALRYLLSPPACDLGWLRAGLEVVGALGIAAAAVPGVLAWRKIGALGIGRAEAARAEGSTQLLLALGVLLSAVFTLATVSLWIPSWIVSPCMD